MLDRHRARLEAELGRHERMLAFLGRLIERKEGVMPYEVEVKEVPAQHVAALRIHTSIATIGRDVASGFETVGRAVGASGFETVGRAVGASGIPMAGPRSS